MRKKIWVALPDSLMIDAPTLREKTDKMGWIGRSLAIFGVQKLFIYHERDGKQEDGELMKLLLEYMETPQYLRKYLFPIRDELKFAGLLPPLRTPHHAGEVPWDQLSPGMVREAVVVKDRGGMLVEVGLARPVELDGTAKLGERLMVVFTQGSPNPRCRRANPQEIQFYTGYTITVAESLVKLIRSSKPALCIATSRLGTPVNELWNDLVSKLNGSESILLLFGSPRKGLYQISSEEGWNLGELTSFVVNFFPGQQVATVRTEEALLGSLSLLNLGILVASA